MSSIKIRKGDNVRVITGRDVGKEGKVIAVNKKDKKVLVEGVNMVKKHRKTGPQNPKGGIINQEAAIDISNVMYIYKGKPTRVGFKIVEGKDGLEKVRIAKTTGETID